MSITNKLKSVPKKPGVYLFKDETGKVIYVGKAINLKNRVSSYFQKSASLEPAKQIMVTKIKDIEYIMVDSETEALFLETTLIKKYHPDYNIIMKDDKSFAYLKIGLKEDYPSVTIVRRLDKDGSRYFGPYTNAKNIKLTVKYLKKIFPVKTCNNKPSDPCFEHRIHRCLGHSTSPNSQAEYQTVVKDFIHFMEGHSDEVVKDLNQQMAEASDQQNYEKAASLRDRIEAINKALERQKVILPTNESLDFISVVKQKNLACINLFVFREGKLIAKNNLIIKNIENQSDAELLASFIEQYYTQSTDHPKTIVVKQLPGRSKEIQKLLQIKITTAQRGKRAQILKLGEANARDTLVKTKASWETDSVKAKEALANFTQSLHLKKQPRRIETYDISNIQGTNAVGSMVVFRDGLPDKSQYRKFKIKTVEQANDPAMMSEILLRRMRRTQAKTDHWAQPDLIILDGGKGQLSAVTKALAAEGFEIPMVALAKRLEEVFFPNVKYPLLLKPDSPALFLLQRMRDEAHRSAIGYYRKTHRKGSIKSQLDEVPGVGPKTKKKLIHKFGSVAGIQSATEEELIKEVGQKTTKGLKEYLG